jgi:hypothetical protein
MGVVINNNNNNNNNNNGVKLEDRVPTEIILL